MTTPDGPRETSLDLAEPFVPQERSIEPSAALPDARPSGEPDPVLAAAVDVARAAAEADAAGSVGEHLGVRADDEHVVSHLFATTLPGYVGWHWAVSLARASDEDVPTVDEIVLLPGDGALLAPAWVPWDERVRPGDLSPGDLLPPPPQDPRLVPGYVHSDDPAVEQVAFELGLGREQVMSREGRLAAADRWQSGDRGPDTPMARHAPGACGTCGFLLLLAGALQAGFGVCGNEQTDTDGQVVSVEYGCGAHSLTTAGPHHASELPDVVYDDGDEIEANPGANASEGADASEGAAHPAVPGHEGVADEAEQEA